MTLDDQIARLMSEAHAYRARAVRLDARLRTLDHSNADLARLRDHLHASAASIDDAVATLMARCARVRPRRTAAL